MPPRTHPARRDDVNIADQSVGDAPCGLVDEWHLVADEPEGRLG